jgi:hypothetical protein
VKSVQSVIRHLYPHACAPLARAGRLRDWSVKSGKSAVDRDAGSLTALTRLTGDASARAVERLRENGTHPAGVRAWNCHGSDACGRRTLRSPLRVAGRISRSIRIGPTGGPNFRFRKMEIRDRWSLPVDSELPLCAACRQPIDRSRGRRYCSAACRRRTEYARRRWDRALWFDRAGLSLPERLDAHPPDVRERFLQWADARRRELGPRP